MKDIEFRVLEKQYAELVSKHRKLNGFGSLEEFIEEYENTWNGTPRIEAGLRNVAYRKNVGRSFEQGNVRWLAIECVEQENEPTYPALGGR